MGASVLFHLVYFVMYISGGKFENTASIFPEILNIQYFTILVDGKLDLNVPLKFSKTIKLKHGLTVSSNKIILLVTIIKNHLRQGGIKKCYHYFS